jgi:hypothetical protein
MRLACMFKERGIWYNRHQGSMRHCVESYLNELMWWGEISNQRIFYTIFRTIKWYWILDI